MFDFVQPSLAGRRQHGDARKTEFDESRDNGVRLLRHKQMPRLPRHSRASAGPPTSPSLPLMLVADQREGIVPFHHPQLLCFQVENSLPERFPNGPAGILQGTYAAVARETPLAADTEFA